MEQPNISLILLKYFSNWLKFDTRQYSLQSQHPTILFNLILISPEILDLVQSILGFLLYFYLNKVIAVILFDALENFRASKL